LFQQALIDPTDNAVAQAEWAARHLRLFDFDSTLLSRPRTYEANAWRAYVAQRWDESLAHAHRWVDDEPFSGRAASMGSAVAAVALEDFEVGIRLARQGVLSNPDDVGLRNNLVFILAEGNRLVEALQEHKRAKASSKELAQRVVWTANSGLLAYRAQRIEEGQARYSEAIKLALDAKNRSLARIAAAYWAGEELRASPPEHPEDPVIDRVMQELQEDSTPDMLLALARLRRIRERRAARVPAARGR
jgi:tetratricopeptide (TPR) repeat protein